MHQFKKILVGVPSPGYDEDGQPIPDPPTSAAINQALDVARVSGCELTLITVVDPPNAGLSSDEQNEKFAERISKEASDALDAVVNGLDTDGVNLSTKVVQGQPWYEMCRAVLADHYDLVMAGTRNVGAIERLMFGGTGRRLLRYCPCPVWIVKPREEEGEQNVLVASQLDDVGHRALRIAVDGANLLDAQVHLLHVLEFDSARRLGLNAEEMDKYQTKVRSEREEQLYEQLAQTDYRTTPYGVQVYLNEGRPHTCILSTIGEHSVDLLIMGTVGRGGLPGVLVGNTAEHLLSEIPCSIMAIKPADFECPVRLEDG